MTAHPAHVFVIDDSADNRFLLQALLEDEGYQITALESGQALLEEVGKSLPDLILLDIMMPEMDGLAILQKLQENSETRKIPVIILTAKAQSSEQRQFSQLNVSSVIAKPYDPMTLSDQISTALANQRP